nr:MAG TPA: hypothetical protein [Caudoviricetes sp.]
MTKTTKIIIGASLVVISTVMTAVGIKTRNTKVTNMIVDKIEKPIENKED